MLHQRYVLLSFVLGAIMTGLTVQSASSSLFVTLQVPDMRLAFMSTTSLISVAAAVLAFVALIRNRQAVSFVDEVVDELWKVTWPTREETVKASTTVVFTTLFTAALLGGYDLIWKNLADVFLFGQTSGVGDGVASVSTGRWVKFGLAMGLPLLALLIRSSRSGAENPG